MTDNSTDNPTDNPTEFQQTGNTPLTDEMLNQVLAPVGPPPLSVSELGQQVRRLLEGRFSGIRVRGEISQPKCNAGSGHWYLRLKDASAVIDAVIWRGVANRLSTLPRDGLEVIATGRVSAYPARSSYQLVIDALEPVGEGELLQLLEARKQCLAAEGLFDPARKKSRPFLPEVIGVITSPAGAVIRDILHRLAGRFPRHVMIWPTPVQGGEAAAGIAAGIAGFNALARNGPVPRPDVLIVARGGGSLEDLMAFNEEVVVRAVAASDIPVISGVGHETDTTLIDHVADLRAPTPSAAAELAVPVRAELITAVLESARRLDGAVMRRLHHHQVVLEGLERGLGEPERLLEQVRQRLDHAGIRLQGGLSNSLIHRHGLLAQLVAELRHPRERLGEEEAGLTGLRRALDFAMRARLSREQNRLTGLAPRPAMARWRLSEGKRRLEALSERLTPAFSRDLQQRHRSLADLGRLLGGISHKHVLARGFALVLDQTGHPLTRVRQATPGQHVKLRFADGEAGATIAGTKQRLTGQTAGEKQASPAQPDLFSD